MKAIFTYIFILIGINCFGQYYVSYWYQKSDTLTQGDSAYIAIKYAPIFNFPQDTLRISIIAKSNNSGLGEVYKIDKNYLDSIPKQSDGTIWLKFKIPSNIQLGDAYFAISFCSSNPSFYIRSSTPDITFVSSDNLHVNSGQIFHFKISYTYKFSNYDTCRIIVNGTEISKESFIEIKNHHDTVSFIVPNYPTGTYPFTFTYWGSNWDPLYITSNTTAVIDPINPPKNIKIHYYNIQGEEIEKPSQGFAIWRAETGESGKVYLLN